MSTSLFSKPNQFIMFTDHWNNTEVSVKERLMDEDFILCKNHEEMRYQVLKKDPLDSTTETVLETEYLTECLSVLL